MNAIISRHFKQSLDDFSESNVSGFFRYMAIKGKRKVLYYYMCESPFFPERPTSGCFPELCQDVEIEQLVFSPRTRSTTQKIWNERNEIIAENDLPIIADCSAASPSKRQRISNVAEALPSEFETA